ncbi:MOSC domain-containing protein [Pleomassaria siparia CBS 279.74]|uniref:MOSC domain-containing protein n=1 Tax=Pleomassaria siparia CBS 279.74 TaxID=1314801 RepID=A0A6G1K384_9PLEO|nr:MOSC domain-containing protein [Pleomassaria siparia CBS 279.74]
MALSDNTSQGAIIISVFLLPILTYVLWQYIQQVESAGPLPSPTEITNLFIYPIKSCHGISVPSARLLPTGLDLDRQWMWVTYPNYEFLTIRSNARMTLIRPTYDASTDTMTITAPAPNSMDEKLQFSMPAHPSPAWLASNTSIVNATVWSSKTPAHCYSTALTGAFNDFFGKEVRLVYKSPTSDSPRALASNGAKKHLGRDASTCFPDLMPILIGCESSIAELNSRLQVAEGFSIDVRRFRPNILVRGNAPWSEDRWKTLRIAPPGGSSMLKLGFDGITLDVTQRCARCHVPNVDPETADEHERQPWDTLMKYRRVDAGITFKPCFGMLCVPRGDGGLVEKGMKLEVTKVTNKHRYITGF